MGEFLGGIICGVIMTMIFFINVVDNKADKNVFIVKKISTEESNFCTYKIQASGVLRFYVVDSIGKFQVGDTLKLAK